MLLSSTAFAEPSYHLVGWINAFVPGGGQLLLENPAYGGLQASLELGAFLWGYNLSARAPFTLDGAPERLPNPLYNSSANLTTALYADLLQEAGLKYHMVNVYNAYREAGAKNVDDSSTLDLFLSPFNPAILENPWVWGGLGVTALAVGASYYHTVRGGVTPVATLNRQSNALYGATYGVVYPLGGGAPEEMFYRGFLQNEFYALVSSPFFSISMSTLAFTFSHQAVDRPSAAASGLYLGWLAYLNHGKLGPGIAYHFWSDVMTGILAIALLQRAQYNPQAVPPISLELLDIHF